MEEFVTLTNNGITMTVPAKEVSLYTRAGYKIVEAPKEPVEKPAKVTKATKEPVE